MKYADSYCILVEKLTCEKEQYICRLFKNKSHFLSTVVIIC
jgi:hypothetical protein